jgi:hypothetical protein
MTFGHGARIEAAENSLTSGLQAKVPEIDTTTVPLFDTSKPYEDQDAEYFKLLLQWPHHKFNDVVLVQIPVPDKEELAKKNVTGRQYVNSVFEELDVKDTGYNNRYVIPSKYVRGIWHTDTQTITLNPEFNPTLLEIKKKKPLTMNQLLGPPASPGKMQTPVTFTNPDSDSDMVW